MRILTGALRERTGGEACDEASLQRTLRAIEDLRENAEAAAAYVRQLAGSSGRRVETPSGTHKRAVLPSVATEEEEEDEEGEEGGAPGRARRRFSQR